jgi:hypothetical protein
MKYESVSGYFKDIEAFIKELSENKKSEASKKINNCLKYINGPTDEWMMFYRNLLSIKEEFERTFSESENLKIDELINAAKNVVHKL